MTVGVSPATVSRVLRRLGLSRAQGPGAGRAGAPLPARAPRRAHPHRHQEARPLRARSAIASPAIAPAAATCTAEARQPAGNIVHVCIDDASRIAFSQILPDEKKESAVAFLHAAVAYYAGLGVTVTRVMTDNGTCYRSQAFRDACKALGLRHIRTKPYTPKTNGKAERFIQTSLREWAYAQAYPTSDHRKAELPRWLHQYNWHRPHGSLQSQTPISRLGLDVNNLLRLHS